MAAATSASACSISSAVELTTDVNNAIEKLQELKRELQTSKTTFADEFCQGSKEIILSLQDLDAVRLKAHDELEVETITSSVLRHRLNTHGIELKREASKAVDSARKANASQLKKLKDEIDKLNEQASDLIKKHEIFDLHNDRMQDELSNTRSAQQDKIRRLNEKISERATLQIMLNETSDQLQSTNNKIKSLTDEIDMLEKKLANRKEELNNEKDRLLKTLDLTKLELNKENLANNDLKIKLSALQDELVSVGFATQTTNRKITEVELEIESLMQRKEMLREDIAKTEEENESLAKINKEIEEQIAGIQNEFKKKHKEIMDRLDLLRKEVEQANTENNALQKIMKTVNDELQEAEKKKNIQKQKLMEIRKKVDDSKSTMMTQAETNIVLTTEKKELEFRILAMKETHKISVQDLKEEAAELKQQLIKERKTRETIEDGYNTLQSDMQQKKDKHFDVMKSFREQINSAESEERIMQDKADQLELEIKTFEQNILAMTKEFNLLTKRLKFVRTDLEEKITQAEEDIAELKEEKMEHDEVIMSLNPEIASLKKSFEQQTEEYENRKKNIIALKNKKASLTDTCIRQERNLAKMPIPQAKLRMDTLCCRANARKWLEFQEESVKGIEEKVSEGERKLNYVTKQNQRFIDAIKGLQKECKRLSLMRDRSKIKEAEMMKQLVNIKVMLDEEWQANKDIAKSHSEKDRHTVDQLAVCETEWEDRDEWLKRISCQFDTELKKFKIYIHKLANPEQVGGN